MLSNAEIIVMRFINTKPSYAYEMESAINEFQYRHWVKIGGPTIYQVLDRLGKKGLLEYKIEKEGNMPQRRRYFITEKGRELLLESVREVLKNIEPYYFDLSIGLACRELIDKDEFVELIKMRLEKLEKFIENFNDIFEKTKELYPTKRLIMRQYLLDHYQLEEKFLRDIIELNETTEE
jgi:Predicted transcriptional regulators